MKNLTVENILNACGGSFHGDAGILRREVAAVTPDSRRVTPDCLFAAISGERTDGHLYIASAAASGALCALGERVPQGFGGSMITVADTVTALQRMAAFYRRQFDIPVIGITGSVGKTTAKEMLYSVLSRRYSVLKTQGNFNNTLGVPLTLFGLREGHEAAVIEMGINHFGEMSVLAEIARPTAAVFTVIGDAHLEFLGSRQGVLRAKTEMLKFMDEGAPVFVNGDDPLLRSLPCASLTTYGLGADCGVRAENVVSGENGTMCDIATPSGRFSVSIPAYGDHMVYAALAAAAVAKRLGLTDEEIAGGISDYVPMSGRARLIKCGKLTIIDDCYNSNPSSASMALASLSRMSGRRVAVLGDMLELGAHSAELHRSLGELAAQKCFLALCCGDFAQDMAEGAGECGAAFADTDALLTALPEFIRPHDAVLVKASHSMGFERVTERLKEIEASWNCAE